MRQTEYDVRKGTIYILDLSKCERVPELSIKSNWRVKPSYLGCAASVRKPSVLDEPPSFRPGQRQRSRITNGGISPPWVN